MSVILATASYDHTIKLWNYEKPQNPIHSIEYSTVKKQSQFQTNKSAFFINRIQVSSDRMFLGAATSFSAMVYDITGNSIPERPKITYDGYQNNVTSIGFKQNNGWIYTGSEEGSVKVHDLKMQGVAKTFTTKDPINQVVLCPNEVELISADQAGNVKIWDLRNKDCKNKITLTSEIGVRSVSVSPNAQFFCAADSCGTLFIYKFTRNDEVILSQKIEKAHDDYILKCQISPSANSIATCSADKTIKIWSLNPQSQKFELKSTTHAHYQWVWDVEFGCDGDFLFSCSSDKLAKLWNTQTANNGTQTMNIFATFRGHKGPVNCVAFNDTSVKN